MQEEINSVEKLTDNLKEYANTRYEMVSLQVAQKTANIGSQSVAIILIAIFGSMFLLFINIAAAYYISSLMNNNFAGFFIVSGFYFLLTLILILCRKKAVVLPLRNLIIKQILNND
ncbi:MAG: phage holin family protein [Bacteroidia bacterium]